MTLSEEDGELFYKLWFPLLNYVNKKKKVNPALHKIERSSSLNINDVKEVANVLWDDTSLIDEYLDEHKEIEGIEREIISGWKRRICGMFILVKHLRKGSILIFSETEEVYQAVGIVSSWKEMFFFDSLPVFIEATLIPFKSVIISDGLIARHNICIGSNLTASFKEVYMNAKKSGKIHSTF